MIKRRISKAAVLLMVVLQILFPLLTALAEIHPLGGVTDKDGSGIQDLDLVISLDWDPAALTGAEADPRGFTQTEFRQVIDSFAKSVFAMTNGLHRLRNIYVFKSKAFWDMADIRYISTAAGRSAANVSGWRKKGNQIEMYVYEDFSNGVYTADAYPGPVLAHECGHYIYGVFDEYQETGAGKKTRAQLQALNDLSMPASDDDNTQPSIMNNHAVYPNWLSTTETYDTTARQNTAQYRMFGKSIWSTIVGNPAADHQNARDYKRTWFDAFNGKSVTAKANLSADQTNALAGYDKTLNIVWMTTDVHTVLVLDSSMHEELWPKALQGCTVGIRQMKPGNWVTILMGNTLVASRTKLTAAAKTTLIDQVSDLDQGSSVSVEASLQAALAQVTRQRTDTGTNMTSNVYLITAANPPVSSAMIKAFANAKAMLTVASYSQARSDQPASGYITVKDLSDITGGKSNITNRAQSLKFQVAREINIMEDDRMTDIAAAINTAPLSAGGVHAVNFTVGPNEEALEITLLADSAEWTKVQPTLTDPSGFVLTAASAAAGFSAETDSATGTWIFRIDTSLYAHATGRWNAALTALAPVSEPLYIVASAESRLLMEVSVRESPLYGYVAQAALKGNRPILNAQVTAAVHDAAGNIRNSLVLKDDGLNGDIKKDDGIYSARIAGFFPSDGEYALVAWANDNNGLAVESNRGMAFSSAAATTETATGAFERTDETAFNVFLNRSSGSDSGWCFIAEAAYGSWLDPHVGELRRFRDQWLLRWEPGRLLVRFYYSWSPGAAAFIRNHDAARIAARIILTPVVYTVRYPFPVLMAVAVPLIYWQRRRLASFIKP